jgi:hypothetical protein
MKEIAFPQFTVQTPEAWFDVTEEMRTEDPGAPATLAIEEGHGAVQFSLAELPADTPAPSMEQLRKMLKEFATGHQLGSPNNLLTEETPRPLLAGNFAWDDDFLRVWYVAEPGKLAFITYTCERNTPFAVELAEVEQIVRSLKFI